MWIKLRKLLKYFQRDERGNLLLFAMIFGSISFTIVVGGIAGYAIYENKASVYKHNRELAFQIAEAGANYYRWHLAHNKTDYWDGNPPTSTGPYMHNYQDKDGNLIGYFSLNISPPATGTTVVVVSSTGWMKDQLDSKRTIKIRLGFPALTDYAFLTNSDVWIGDTEVTHGKFHANGGIHYDGWGDAPITSAKEEYTCQEHHGCGNGQLKPGIWGNGGPTSYWQFPVPLKDFSAVTAKLAEIKQGAQNGGIYLSSSGYEGWRISFQSNGTVKVIKVRSCTSYRTWYLGDPGYVWRCLDIRSYSGNWITYSMPSNGYIYVEDRVWVDGTVNGRATVGVAQGKSIMLNNNIIYLAKDGQHVLGLIAEQDITIPRDSPNDLEVDAALLAQNGAAKRYYYPGGTGKKNSIYIYGSVISNGIWTWSWESGGTFVSGYKYTNSTYDSNLTYSPPPGFPVGSEYNLISWEEMEYDN